LEKQQRYTLGKTEKLKSAKTIEQLFKEGKSFSVAPFRVIYLFKEEQAGHLQTAFSVSKRHFKKATDRNRIKRLMREAWRLQKNELALKIAADGKHIAVFLIYTGNELPVYNLVFEKATVIIKRLAKICNEATLTHT
jgi:ribonuclease P protein component